MRTLLRATMALAMILPAAARAQSPGPFTGAEVLAPNTHLVGAYLQTGDHALGLMSQLRLSFYPGVDFGFQGGLTRLDVEGGSDRTLIRVGADVRASVLTVAGGNHADVSLGGGLGIESGDDYGTFSLGPSVWVSRAYPLGATGAVAPFAKLGLAYSSLNAGPIDDNDLWIPLDLGAEFRPNPALRLVGEFELRLNNDLNDDWSFAAGAHFPF